MLSMPRHRSPRSIPAVAGPEVGSPAAPATRRRIKQNKELAEYSGVLFHRSRSLACDDYITRIDAARDASMIRVHGKSPQILGARRHARHLLRR